MIINGKVFNPGRLRTLITLHQRTVTTGDGGFQVPSTSEIGEVWSAWKNVHGQEAWLADSANAKLAATVIIRWNEAVNETCLVEKGGEMYEIVTMDNIEERDEYIELKVKAWRPG